MLGHGVHGCALGGVRASVYCMWSARQQEQWCSKEHPTTILHPPSSSQIAGQNETCPAVMGVPANYLRPHAIRPIGLLLAHGADADDWDSALMRALVERFAAAGHIVMRYHCRQKEARRQRILERALESAALSPLALASVEQWVVVGYDNGARVAAAVAAKTRIRIGGYVALSYPLLVSRC